MKNLGKNVTVTATVASLALLFSAPVQAATFLFSYQFLSGDTLSGTLEGELQADNNTVSHITNLSATYSGTGEIYTQVYPYELGDTASLNGSYVWLNFEPPGPSYIEINSLSGFIALQSGNVSNSETFSQSRWTMTRQSTPNVPEPSLLGGLAFLGLMFHTLKRVNQ